MDDIYDIKRRHAMEFLRLPGVSGFGVERTSDGQYYFAVHLSSNDPGLMRHLPSWLEGYPVRSFTSGDFSPY
jgi:hypothetical protein